MRTQSRFQLPAILLAIFLVFLVTSCEVEKEENKPVVATVDVTEIKSKEALCSGLIISDGGYAITACGVCWSTEQNPTIDDNTTTDSTGAGSFSSKITGLQPKANYYVRAYATNSKGTGYGSTVSFTTLAPTIPDISTTEVCSITDTTAQCGGVINCEGGDAVLEAGVCWSISNNPTIADNKTIENIATDSFTSILTGLNPNTKYFVRAYATNSVGTAYGSEISFTTKKIVEFNPNITYGTMTDIEGHVYKTVTIGNQIWMAENLKVTKYNDGVSIPNVTDSTAWSELTTGAYCNYHNSTHNDTIEPFGRLFNWYAVESGKLCPIGWHVPSDAEWTELTDYLGGANEAGGKLKEIGATHWNSPNIGATNESGFTAIPVGYRADNGTFAHIGFYALWWSSTEYDEDKSWDRDMSNTSSNIVRYRFNKGTGLSVRCVKD